jgi:hypothetical protein
MSCGGPCTEALSLWSQAAYVSTHGCRHPPSSSLNSIVQGFYGGFISKARLLKSWAVSDLLNLQPSTPTPRLGWAERSSSYMIGSPGNQFSSSKGHYINISLGMVERELGNNKLFT